LGKGACGIVYLATNLGDTGIDINSLETLLQLKETKE